MLALLLLIVLAWGLTQIEQRRYQGADGDLRRMAEDLSNAGYGLLCIGLGLLVLIVLLFMRSNAAASIPGLFLGGLGGLVMAISTPGRPSWIGHRAIPVERSDYERQLKRHMGRTRTSSSVVLATLPFFAALIVWLFATGGPPAEIDIPLGVGAAVAGFFHTLMVAWGVRYLQILRALG